MTTISTAVGIEICRARGKPKSRATLCRACQKQYIEGATINQFGCWEFEECSLIKWLDTRKYHQVGHPKIEAMA